MSANKDLTALTKTWQKTLDSLRKKEEEVDELKELRSEIETEIGDILNPGNMELNEEIGIWVRMADDREECLVVVKKTNGYALYLRRARFDSVENNKPQAKSDPSAIGFKG